MATNMLSPNQASFETSLTGWTGVDHPPTPPNLLTENQASVETGVTDWVARGGQNNETPLTWVTDDADHGTASVLIRKLAGFTGNSQLTPGGMRAAVTPGATYTLVWSALTNAAAMDTYVQPQMYDANNVVLGVLPITGRVTLQPGVWTRCSATFVIPIDQPVATIASLIGGSPVTNTNYLVFDRMGLFAGEVAPNDWHLPSQVGQTMARVAASTAPDGGYIMALTRAAGRGVLDANTTTFPAVAGTTYTAMAEVQAPVGRLAGVQLEMLDAGGAVIDSERVAVNGTGGWAMARTSAVAGTGVATVRMRVLGSDFLADEILNVDKAGLFDGYAVAWAPGGQVAPALFVTVLDPNRHRVGVTLLGLESDDPVYIDRILPDGRIERVRNAQGLEPAGGGVFFDDYDSPTDAGFRYRATQGGVVVATSDLVTLPSNGRFFLMDPNLPMEALPVIPAANAIPQWSRTAPVGVYRVLGRQDPIVVTDVRWWAEGEFTCYTLTANQRDAMGRLSAQGLTVGLYGPAEVLGGIGRIYLVGSQVDERRVSPRGTEQAREWHVQVTQVAQPTQVPRTTPLVDWGDVVAAYDTWQDVVDNEVDWTDVMTGVPGAEGTGPDVGWEW